jgi:sarcosine oxidase subunit beta
MGDAKLIDRPQSDRREVHGRWCEGGFKATPASGGSYAHLLATDTPHEFAEAYRFDRFEKGQMIDEKGVGNNPQLH